MELTGDTIDGCWFEMPSKDGKSLERWRIRTLIEASRQHQIEFREVASIERLREHIWEDIESVYDFARHMRRVQDAELQFPILLHPDGWVMDGLHRAVKAMMLGCVAVMVVQFPTMPPPDETKPLFRPAP